MIRWSCLVVSICVLYVGNANAVIVDLNSRVNDLNHTVDLLLDAGTYTIDAIGTADGGAWNAWNAWGATTCGNPNGCPRTSPTSVVGWLNIYSFGSAGIVNAMINGIAAVPTVGDTYYVDQFVAYPDPLSALANAWSAEFTLTSASLVSFAIPDRPVSDNRGGMSLDVNASVRDVPEPATLGMLGAGLMLLSFGRRKKQR